MKIYEKLAQVRDKVSLEEDPIVWEDRAYVLEQILGIAFTNEIALDEIPDVLNINCRLNKEELEDLLGELELIVKEVKLEYGNPEDDDPKEYTVFLF